VLPPVGGVLAAAILSGGCLRSLARETATSTAKRSERVAATTVSLLPNVGFEQAATGGTGLAEGWDAYGQGYVLDDAVQHTGSRSIRCTAASSGEAHGAAFSIELSQKRPQPVEVTGWSRAEKVDGLPDADYSLYLDIQYQDGSVQYAVTSNFTVGTHDWEQRRLVLAGPKAIKHLTVYPIFRNHTGMVWFDDVEGRILAAPFDAQAIAPPALAPGIAAGWFARDVADNSEVLPLSGGDAGLGLTLTVADRQQGRILDATLRNQTDRRRAITLYYVERFDPGRTAAPPRWWQDIRTAVPVRPPEEVANRVSVNAGAIGAISLYPFGCVTTANAGRALGISPDQGPRIARIGYHPASHLLYVAFDLALPPQEEATTRPPVTASVARYDVDPQWGFRDAAARFYTLFPDSFTRRAKRDGIWIPFTSPTAIPHVQDFGVAWHEGDNSIDADHRLGIASFHYTEPRSYVQSLPRSVPRTYEAAVAAITAERSAAASSEARHRSEAVFLSGAQERDGRFVVSFEKAPWSDGAVWMLNPNPTLSHAPEQWTQARVNFSEQEQARYGAAAGSLDGEFLDSLEAAADGLDFRPESLDATRLPLTFTTDDSRQTTLPIWFSEYEYVDWLGRWLHARGKLLFANTTLTRFGVFAPPLDLMGIEANWGTSQDFGPDSDAVFNFRRTLCYHKPYLLLQNNDFDRFGHDATERYFRRCLFYGVFPSFFSVNAADKPYWENAKWYDRDRDLFKRYIPLIKRVSAAGWEPVTYAHSDNPNVYLERYGHRYLTIRNAARTTAHAVIRWETTFLSAKSAGIAAPTDLLQPGRRLAALRNVPAVELSLQPDEVCLLDLGSGAG